MQFYNTLGRELQDFTPLHDSQVTFYQCGPTVYSRQHIGNLFSPVKGDLIRRALAYLGYSVEYTRNITDVGHLTGENAGDADTGEDKMAKGARKEKKTPEQIAKHYTDLYHADLKKLNVLDPTYETVATEYVNQMAEMVQKLIDKGFAYATEKAIYFEVDTFDRYNELNQQKLDKNTVGAGHGSESDLGKKKPYDFAIWFFKVGAHEHALQTWDISFKNIDQPTLAGFPGWHIECSSMAKDTLGETIDIHMGGVEHIPVHHTNEIAQSESANGELFARYWLHHELLQVDGGKMSKSLGNGYTLDDVLAKGFDALDYRYFLLQAHYRSKQNFTWEALEGAKNAREKLLRQMSNLIDQLSDEEFASLQAKNFDAIDADFDKDFRSFLEQDVNIPGALSVVWEVLKSDVSPSTKLATILSFDTVLGLRLTKSFEQVSAEEYSEEVLALIAERKQARIEKNWELADSIRDRLREEFRVEVRDGV